MCSSLENAVEASEPIPSPIEAIDRLQKNGVFSDNISPLRSITKKTLNALSHFVWETFQALAELVKGREITKDEFDSCCKDTVNIGILNPIIYSIKKKYGLSKSKSNYAKLPSGIREEAGQLLEDKATPFLPLAACTGCWGAKTLSMRMWQRTTQYYLVDEQEEMPIDQNVDDEQEELLNEQSVDEVCQEPQQQYDQDEHDIESNDHNMLDSEV